MKRPLLPAQSRILAEFGENIKYARLRRDLSSEQISERAAISLYIFSGTPEQEELLFELGTFKMGKGCIYIKKLSDISLTVLKKLITENISYLVEKYG